MNTEQAERILKLFADSLEQGKGFVLDQAPEIAQQVILWKRTEYIVIIAILLFVALLCAMVTPKAWRFYVTRTDSNETNCATDAEMSWLGVSVFSALIGCACMIAALINIVGSLQVWLAPKAFLLEYAADLLKG